MSIQMFNVAASKGISWSINQHKVEKDGDTRVLYVCTECHTADRKCIMSRYYAMKSVSHEEINDTLAQALCDSIRMFIGEAPAAATPTPTPAPNPASVTLPRLMPRTSASRPADVETETDDEQPQPTRRGRGRPPKATPSPVVEPVETVALEVAPDVEVPATPAIAPVEPKTRKDPKPPKVIVKYTLGDKTLSAALGTLLTEMFGADFRKDVELYERIKACRNDLIGIPMLADGVITDEFVQALKEAVGVDSDDEDDL
jgi:hypothetical protein